MPISISKFLRTASTASASASGPSPSLSGVKPEETFLDVEKVIRAGCWSAGAASGFVMMTFFGLGGSLSRKGT